MIEQADRIAKINAVLLEIENPLALILFEASWRRCITQARFRVDTIVYTRRRKRELGSPTGRVQAAATGRSPRNPPPVLKAAEVRDSTPVATLDWAAP